MHTLIEKESIINSIRECAKAAHDNWDYEREQGYLEAIECINEEPIVQQWIPCANRLPEH